MDAPIFTPGLRPRSADLNRLAAEAASAHPAGASFLAADNGSALALRSPRRDPPPVRFRASSGADHLLVRLSLLSARPSRPLEAWTLDGARVNVPVLGARPLLVYATDLAGEAETDGDAWCVAHRVTRASVLVREQS